MVATLQALRHPKSEPVVDRVCGGPEFAEKSGAPGETRTPNPLLRRQMLYPVELRAPECILRQSGVGAHGDLASDRMSFRFLYRPQLGHASF